jgi:hypothetical protein
MKDLDAVFFHERPGSRTGRKVIASPALSIARESPGSRRSSSRTDFGITTRPALSIVRWVVMLPLCAGLTHQEIPLEGPKTWFRIRTTSRF